MKRCEGTPGMLVIYIKCIYPLLKCIYPLHVLTVPNAKGIECLTIVIRPGLRSNGLILKMTIFLNANDVKMAIEY